MKQAELSIIILSFNTKDLLRTCLDSVKKAKVGLGVQTIVVDNHSADGSAEMVEKEFGWVELVRSRRNLGFAGGNNLGLKKVRGKYILFLNSDMKLKPEALKESLEFIKSDPKVGAVTAKTLLVKGGMDPDCHRGFPTPWASMAYFLGLEKLLPKVRLFGGYHKFYLNLDKSHEIDAGCGAFMLVRGKVLDQVGKMDESYFFYGEDLDLYYRIKEAGWKVMFLAKPLVWHYKGASSGLRKESRGITKATRKTKIRSARASVKAMEIFYKKFYKGKYNPLITLMVLLGIRVKGVLRVVKFWLGG
jgi:GT2 family glycosyltransferase